MLSEKHRPKNMNEYVGQKDAKEYFVKWVKSWKSGGKALMLYGPPGVGKTSLVEAYAKENNIDLVETNASDVRSAEELRSTLSSSVSQQSLFKKNKIFLIDEADGVSGYEDKGGVGEMIEMIKSSKHPIVLVANDPYNPKLRSLRQYCELLSFKKLASWDVHKRLTQIAEKEKMEVAPELISLIAKRSQGDMRSAINDLHAISNDKTVDYDMLEDVGVRERETNIFEALRSIFKSQDVSSAKKSINGVEKDPDEIFWWVENNVAAEYEKPEEIAKAFDALSQADVFRQRIRSRQNWKFLAYMIDLMTGGVSASKKFPYAKFTKYQYPSNIMILGRSKESRGSTKSALVKLSKALNCSTRKVRREYVPYIKMITSKEGEKEKLAESFGLTDEEMSSLTAS